MADVANRTRLESICREINPQLVFHVVAYKNAELMEVFLEAIRTYIEGVLNVVELSLKYDVN